MAKKETTEGQERQIQIHVSPELEYHYRDMFTINVGMEEVIIELGNRHRSVQDKATISDRVVLSVQNAFRLQQALGKSLANVQQQMQQKMQEQQENKG